MSRVVHLIVGPDQHGVVLHAQQIASLCGHRWVRQLVCAPDELRLDRGDVVHVAFTDRLFGRTAEASAEAFGRLADAVEAAQASLSVTLHDLPFGDDELHARRARCYASVVGRCRGVVVNSWHELTGVQDWAAQLRSLRVIALPLKPVAAAGPVPSGADVGILGFVYPDRGYDKVLGELPAAAGLVALGAAALGHEDLPDSYAAQARHLGRPWHCTGYLDSAELRRRLTTVAVPVAPNQRVSASSSINTWLEHGRRPLVARSRYAEEFEHDNPGSIVLYDADHVGQLGALITQRLNDPAATVLDLDCTVGSNLDRITDDYQAHLSACLPPAPIEVSGRYVLPDNRWDLVPTGTRPGIDVSVIVPYFQAQSQLDLVLTGLSLQTYPRSRLQVIVADDGSSTPPRVAVGDLPVQVVRQEDRGFRAAAARNLGASVAEGQVLVFLDGDTVPEPNYVERLVRLPSAAHDLLITGRRRHADLSNLTPKLLASWLSGLGDRPVELPAPSWLIDGYCETDNLLNVDVHSYRLMISAVMGVDRALFAEIGGFDPTIEGYGGEDWEMAYRAYQAGAVFAHAPEAVAWHDGPDWAGRNVPKRQAVKNAETLVLAQRIPDSSLRDGQPWPERPAAVITVPAADEFAIVATARSAFVAQPDCCLWLTGDGAEHVASRLADPRIRPGQPPAAVLASCRVLVELERPVDLSGLAALAEEAERLGEVVTPVGRLTSSRALARNRRWQGKLAATGQNPRSLFARHDRNGLDPWPVQLDLGRVLAGLRRQARS